VSENLDLVRAAYENFARTGQLSLELYSSDFVWDMSHFHGWPERQEYLGPQGASEFIRDWGEAWEEWTLEVESFHDAGDEIVAVVRQSGRPKASGARVDMRLAQIWTVRDGQFIRMRMFSDPAEALAAADVRQGTNTP
jgi:ketosteroid isomerase-like protein